MAGGITLNDCAESITKVLNLFQCGSSPCIKAGAVGCQEPGSFLGVYLGKLFSLVKPSFRT